MNTYQKVYAEKRKTGETVKAICKRRGWDYQAYLSERSAFAGSFSSRNKGKRKVLAAAPLADAPQSGGKVVVMIGTIEQVRELLK